MIKRYNGLVIGFMMIGITSIVNNELEVFASEVDVIEKSIEALNEITSLNGTISMLQDYKTEEIEIASGVTAEIEEVCEPFSFHAEGSMWMDLFDINMTCEKYGQMEEESMHIYSSDYIDSWYKDTIDPAMQMSMKDIISPEFFKKIGLELESGEETKDYLESEVYSVTAVCDGEIFNNILDKTFEYLSTGWSMDLDFTNASLDLEILLDADSFLPMNIKFTISEEELTKISTDDTDDMIPTYFEYKIVIDEYNTLDSIIIPEDVIEAADSYDTLNEYDEMGSFENEVKLV